MGNGNWYSTGFDAADQEKDERERRRNTPWRFFLKQGQAAEIVFLDDFSVTHKIKLPNGDEIERPIVPFSIDEHNLTVDGDWKNWFTCLKKIDPPCPICSASHRPYYVGMLSVLAKWVDDDGNAHWGKKIFAGKLNGIERIRRQLSKKGNLLYCKYEVARTGDRSEVTGDDYEFVERLTKEQVEALVEGQENVDVNPYDYMEMFAPKEKKELETLMKSGRVAPARKNAGKTTSAAPKAQVSVASDSGDSKASDNPAEEIEF